MCFTTITVRLVGWLVGWMFDGWLVWWEGDTGVYISFVYLWRNSSCSKPVNAFSFSNSVGALLCLVGDFLQVESFVDLLIFPRLNWLLIGFCTSVLVVYSFNYFIEGILGKLSASGFMNELLHYMAGT